MLSVTQWFAVIVILIMTAVTVWDLWVLMVEPQLTTVSLQLYMWGQKTPILYFWVGICMGHLLLPLVIRGNGH